MIGTTTSWKNSQYLGNIGRKKTKLKGNTCTFKWIVVIKYGTVATKKRHPFKTQGIYLNLTIELVICGHERLLYLYHS